MTVAPLPQPWSVLARQLDDLTRAPTIDDLERLAAPLTHALGGRLLALAQIAVRAPGRAMTYATGVFPRDWRQRYEAENLGLRDPLAEMVAKAKRPFALQSALHRPDSDAAVRRHYEAHATDIGMAYPLQRGLGADVCLVVFAGAFSDAEPELEAQRRLAGLTFGEELLLRLRESAAAPKLTPRQRACLIAAERGCNSLQIAAELGLAAKTVDVYLAAAAERLGAQNRLAAVATALRLGLI